MFSGYLETRARCEACALDLRGHRADDAPPYVTIMIVGHAIIPMALAFRQIFEPALWLQFAIWAPLLLGATFWLLPIAKAWLIALQWGNAMHGFAGPQDAPSPDA